MIGTSGAGKTTFAGRWSEMTGCQRIELDELFWGPNWQMTPDELFFERVEKAIAAPCWVVAGNYTRLRPLLWNRATSIIWLDFPFPLVFWRVLKRTMTRCWTKEPILNGNRESFTNAFFKRDSILLWCVQTFSKNRRHYSQLVAGDDYPHLQFFRLSRRKQAENMLVEMTR